MKARLSGLTLGPWPDYPALKLLMISSLLLRLLIHFKGKFRHLLLLIIRLLIKVKQMIPTKTQVMKLFHQETTSLLNFVARLVLIRTLS